MVGRRRGCPRRCAGRPVQLLAVLLCAIVSTARAQDSIIVINPAEPPIIMRNTIYAAVDLPADEQKVRDSVLAMAGKIRSYVPGFKVTVEPFLDGDHFTVCNEVTGAGDYLPSYSGNLDIITAAAINVAENWAETFLKGRKAANE